MPIKAIGFDADDTLWINEPYFQEIEQRFCLLLEDFLEPHEISKELFKTEISNIELYGYGVKAFILSMLETAARLTGNSFNAKIASAIIGFGKEMLSKEVELIDGTAHILNLLKDKYRLVVATKGDLLDQERKLRKSGLESYFHHVEIMSEKGSQDYSKLIHHLDILPEEFVMVGNSLKSDIIPVIEIGGYGIHIPFHTTWAHEKVDIEVKSPRFRHANSIYEVAELISTIK